MLDKMKAVESRFEELNLLLSEPQVMSDQTRYRRLVQEHADLQPLVESYRELIAVDSQLADNRELFNQSDEREFKELVREEIGSLEDRKTKLEELLNESLSPKDPNDQRNVFIEVRAGAGGEEAALFAGVLLRMYTVYAEARGWKTNLVDASETELGGIKEAVLEIDGRGAYSRFKFESGVHRVQRVPVTESGGRIHTSTVTVAVMPEADDVEIHIDPNDLDIDTYRASGAGGQHVNKTDSAIRITHKPSGLVVTCQDQRSQHKNKERAMAVLRSRLFEMEQTRQSGERAFDRKSQVGTGDRSERIRTYNYHQGRVTDHRIGLTLYKLDDILAGDLDPVIQPLITAWQTDQLGKGQSGPED